MTRAEIMGQALRCLDEIYPEDNSANTLNFPLEEFADEAARRVLLAAPLHAVPCVSDFSGAGITAREDGSGEIALPDDFLRLARLRMEGWKRPVTVLIPEESAAYPKQFHPATRGGCAKPAAVLVRGGKALEYFSVTGTPRIAEALYIPFSGIGEEYPDKLGGATAWMLAALVLSVSNDPPGAKEAEARAGELLRLL